MQKKLPVLVIVGPTAVGKTGLGVSLAKQFDGEIISGDALQVYRHLSIGTAKATVEEQQGVPHYLLDERELADSFSVSDFQRIARERIADCHQRGKLPIVVGGTGLYIQALLFEFELGGKTEATSQKLREELEAYGQLFGAIQLWERLKKQDPNAAAAIHPNNVKRVIRAIEVIELTGVSITAQEQVDFSQLSNALYDVKLIGLWTERAILYERINQRVDQMLLAGLEDEARMVFEHGPCQGAQGIGYKEFFPYFQGAEVLTEAIAKVKQNSRRYAKRQLTWFNNRMPVEWWDLIQEPTAEQGIITEIAQWLDVRKEVTV